MVDLLRCFFTIFDLFSGVQGHSLRSGRGAYGLIKRLAVLQVFVLANMEVIVNTKFTKYDYSLYGRKTVFKKGLLLPA